MKCCEYAPRFCLFKLIFFLLITKTFHFPSHSLNFLDQNAKYGRKTFRKRFQPQTLNKCKVIALVSSQTCWLLLLPSSWRCKLAYLTCLVCLRYKLPFSTSHSHLQLQCLCNIAHHTHWHFIHLGSLQNRFLKYHLIWKLTKASAIYFFYICGFIQRYLI
jgi:hypothetical protein